MDERVGFILKALEEKKLATKTLIIFTSDHGEHFGEHRQITHGGSYYEELQHVPLILCGPMIPTGNISEKVSLSSLPATINDYLNLPKKLHTENTSFFPLLHDGQVEQTSFHFTGVRPRDKIFKDALIWDKYKLIVKFDESFLLYDLSIDPHEQNNISELEQDITHQMVEKLELARQKNQNEKQKILRLTPRNSIQRNKHDDQDTIGRLKSLGYIK